MLFRALLILSKTILNSWSNSGLSPQSKSNDYIWLGSARGQMRVDRVGQTALRVLAWRIYLDKKTQWAQVPTKIGQPKPSYWLLKQILLDIHIQTTVSQGSQCYEVFRQPDHANSLQFQLLLWLSMAFTFQHPAQMPLLQLLITTAIALPTIDFSPYRVSLFVQVVAQFVPLQFADSTSKSHLDLGSVDNIKSAGQGPPRWSSPLVVSPDQ